MNPNLINIASHVPLSTMFSMATKVIKAMYRNYFDGMHLNTNHSLQQRQKNI